MAHQLRPCVSAGQILGRRLGRTRHQGGTVGPLRSTPRREFVHGLQPGVDTGLLSSHCVLPTIPRRENEVGGDNGIIIEDEAIGDRAATAGTTTESLPYVFGQKRQAQHVRQRQ